MEEEDEFIEDYDEEDDLEEAGDRFVSQNDIPEL